MLGGLFRGEHWSHRRGTVTIIGAIAVGAALVAGGVSLLLVGIMNLRSGNRATLRSDALLEAAIQVEGSVVDAETGLRGYVITDARVFLAPLRVAERSLPSQTASLNQAANREHDHTAEARRLSSAADSYIATYVRHVLALMHARPARARSYAVTLSGKRRVDAIRHLATGLATALTAQAAARQHAAAGTADDDITYSVVALVVLVLLTLAIEGTFGRLLLSRRSALERSNEIADTLQTSLLPLTIPEIPGCELAIRFTPAATEAGAVGGDFYDVFELDSPNRWAVVLGDVCGKDANAAATTAVARWTLRSASLLIANPTDVIRHLNEVMRRRSVSLFVTIAYVLLEVGPDEIEATIVCAGHPPPIVVGGGQPPYPVSARGDLVGIWPEIRLHTQKLRLHPGDVIIAYTDGAIEFARGPAQPLEQFILEAGTTSASKLAAAIEGRARSGRVAPHDDIAIVAIQFNGAAPDTRAADGLRVVTTPAT